MWCHDIRLTLVCQIIFFFPKLDVKHVGNSVGAGTFCFGEVICSGSLHVIITSLCEAVTHLEETKHPQNTTIRVVAVERYCSLA